MVYVVDEYGRKQGVARIEYVQCNLANRQSVVAGFAQHTDYFVGVFACFAHIIRAKRKLHTYHTYDMHAAIFLIR